MDIKQVSLIYFSPTGTTRKVLESIANGIAVEQVRHVDLTLAQGARQSIAPFGDELVLIGAPVYGGRLPVEAVRRFKRLTAGETLAIPIVVYGNREFEDALLELKNLAMELGFRPVAGGAFIGEHSFSSKALPIAPGRPDRLDVQKATEFGARIKAKLATLSFPGAQPDLLIPGRFPYEGGARAMAVSPVTKEDICTVCGTCAGVCPMAAISINGSVATDVERCSRCCACVKSCPTGARVWEDPTMKKIATWLNENCSARKEPQLFGVDG